MNAAQVLSFLLAYSVQVALLVAAALPLPRLLRLRKPRLRLAYYQGLLGLSLLLPAGWLVPAASTAKAPLADFRIELTVPAAAGEGTTPWLWLVPAVLAAGSVWRLARLVAGVQSLRRLPAGSRPLAVSALLEAALNLRFRRRPSLWLSESLGAPVSFGWRRPAVVVPGYFPDLSPAMQEAILVHEWMHVERGDWAATAFEEVVSALLWFHPAILFLVDRIRLSREQTVDSAVVQYTGRTRIYLESLRHAALTFRQASLAATIPFMRASHLRQRVVALTEEVCMSRQRQLCVCAVLVAAAALSAAAVVVALPAPGNPQPGVIGASLLPVSSAVQAEEKKAEEQKGKEEKEGTIGLSDETNLRTRLVKRVNPVYPEQAKEEKITGRVICRVNVSEEGKPEKVTVLESPHELLSGAAMDAIKQWEWAPVEKEGRKVPFTADVTVNFQLK
ncbi:MAG: hypothetical protein Kow001_14590 [Acidobacteriota bacterium]